MPRKARGFSLIEVSITVIIVGILLAIIAPTLMGSRTSAQALAITRLADAAAANYVVLTSVLGVSTDVATSQIPAVGLTVDDVLFQGVGAVSPPFADAYLQSGIKPLSNHVSY